jgi:hypothetical protein
LISYEFASSEEITRHGLWADYVLEDDSSAAVSRVDPIDDLAWGREGLPLEPPFSVHWRGVVYLADGGTLGLQAITDEPVEVRLDGRIVYSTSADQLDEAFVELLAGWHPVEITLEKQHEGGTIRLAWTTANGERRAVQPFDLFPLAELDGWLHERSWGFPGDRQRLVSQRLDFAPHYASAMVLKLQAQEGVSGPFLTGERWRGVWEVTEPGDYLLKAEFRAGALTLVLDGVPLPAEATTDQGQRVLEADVTLDKGRHTLELVQEFERDVPWSGAILSVLRPAPPPAAGGELEPVPLQVTPY